MKAILYLFCNVPALIEIQYMMNYLSQYVICVVSSKRSKCVSFFLKQPNGVGLLFLASVLIDQNYVAIVVILITFNSSTETDIFVSEEYIVSV